MADQEDEELRMALRMSMQGSPPEPKRSKPRDAPMDESPEVKNRRVQRELMAAAAEKRMLDARKNSPPPVSHPAGSASRTASPKAVKKDGQFGAQDVNLGKELTEAEANQLFAMVFGAEVSRDILAQWSNQGIRCVY